MTDADGMPKFRPRTHSDPDLPQLLPLPVRPHTSYESRPQIKEHAQFSEDVVLAMSRKLGIDIADHPELRWVVRDCLLALKDEGWSCHLAVSDLTYVHAATEETRSFHPVADVHRQLAERLLVTAAQQKQKSLDSHHVIRQLMFQAIMGETDCRKVTNPQLMRRLVELLDIDIQTEPYLIRRVKLFVEDAYFRMKDIGAHRVTVENCANVQQLVVLLEIDRVNFLKKISPSGLLYCVECQTALADVISAGCHDVFCNTCAVATHSTGHRQDVPMIFIEQAVCSECEQKAALVRDEDDADLYCYDCFKATHQRGKRKRHCVRLPMTTFCDYMEDREASYICMETGELMCSKYATRYRSRGARKNHTLYGLRKAAYSKRLFADNLERLTMIVQKHADQSLPLSPWFIFYDDALAPYWYNFQTRERTRANPDDLINPPRSEAETEGEMFSKAAELDADEQMVKALPGSTDLLATHAAQKAAEGAIFHVPPPMHIRFASPATVSEARDMQQPGISATDFRKELADDGAF